MKYTLLILTFLLWGFNVFPQQIIKPVPENSDRYGAVELTSDTVICTSSPAGFGFTQEFKAPKTSLQSIEKEHHTIWYSLKPKQSCDMEFLLTPDKSGDDYDFMLLECDSPCSSAAGLNFLRSNISRNNKSIGSITGLSSEGTEPFVGEGPGNAFSTPVRLKAGHTYYLVVDNVYNNGGGHKIVFKTYNCQEPEAMPTKKPHILSLKIVDKESGEKLDAKVLLIKRNFPAPDDTLINKKGFLFLKDLDTSKYYKLKVSGDSCLSYREEFLVYGDDTMMNKTIELQRIRPGKKIKIDNIYFRGGSAEFLRKSYPALRNLVFIMKENPKLEIEIQGHVNQPYNQVKRQKESYYQDLSESRARAVYYYLIKRGIDKNRLTYKGFGYSKMIFPYAKTGEEMQQNRRVEILIKKM